MKPISPALLRNYAGKWVVLNRQEDTILGSGRTFDEAKQAAAAIGEHSVVLAKAPSDISPKGRKPHWLWAVAVFVSLSQSVGEPQGSFANDRQDEVGVQQLDEEDPGDVEI